jgi:hypothetical protein
MTEGSSLGNVNGLTDVILITGAGLDKPLVYVKLEPENLGGTMNGKIDAKVDTNDADLDDSFDEHFWEDDGGFVPDEDPDEQDDEDETTYEPACDDPDCPCHL